MGPGLKRILATVSLAALLGQSVTVVAAQELDAEMDFRLWCALALLQLGARDAFPSEDEATAARAAAEVHSDIVSGAVAGMNSDRFDELLASYQDEVFMQLDDYQAHGDAEALRFSLDSCVATGV